MTAPVHPRPGDRRGRPGPRPRPRAGGLVETRLACFADVRQIKRAGRLGIFATLPDGQAVELERTGGERLLAARRVAVQTAAGGPFSPVELLVLFAVAAGGEADAEPFTLARLSAETGRFRGELVTAAMGLVGRGVVTETRTQDARGEPVTSLHLSPVQVLALPASVMVAAIRTYEAARAQEAAR